MGAPKTWWVSMELDGIGTSIVEADRCDPLLGLLGLLGLDTLI